MNSGKSKNLHLKCQRSLIHHQVEKDLGITKSYFVAKTQFLSFYLSICLSVYLSICLSVYMSICLSIIYLSIYLSICLSIYLSICLSLHLSICQSVYLSIYLYICPLFNLLYSIHLLLYHSDY